MVIKLVYDIDAIQRAIMAERYDKNALQISKSGRYKYPSKYLFVKLLEPIVALPELADIEGNIKITSDPPANGIERIHVLVEWKAK